MALTPITRNKDFFSDFESNLERIPGREDIARRVNEQAVRDSIRNLVLTDRGERLFQPDIGCDIRGSLFENIDQNTILILKENIKSTIRQYEPRCLVKDIIVNANIDRHEVFVKIIFSVINTNRNLSLTIDLSRVR
jgi:phage baseplate assembly protein W